MTDTILLTVPATPSSSSVVSLVLGGLGSRLDLAVDRIDELALAATTASLAALQDVVELELNVHDDRLVLRMGPLADGATADTAHRRVLEPLVDRVGSFRRSGQEWLELELRRGVAG